MRRLASVILAVVLLAGCGSGGGGVDETGQADVTVGSESVTFIGMGSELRQRAIELDGDHYLAGCTVAISPEDFVVSVDFHHAAARTMNDHSSITDLGDGSGLCGSFDASTGEEWSTPGSRSSATVEAPSALWGPEGGRRSMSLGSPISDNLTWCLM